jgi:hypothetical protein
VFVSIMVNNRLGFGAAAEDNVFEPDPPSAASDR